jgi:hypothetical protein
MYEWACPNCGFLAIVPSEKASHVCPSAPSLIREGHLEELDWTTCGIIELAVRNPNVSSYMDHWEGRALKAEALSEGHHALIEKWRVDAARHESDHWCNTDDAPIWKAIHREVALQLRQCADELAALLGDVGRQNPQQREETD